MSITIVNAFMLDEDVDVTRFLFDARDTLRESEPEHVLKSVFSELVYSFHAGREKYEVVAQARELLKEERERLSDASLFLYEAPWSGERFVRFAGVSEKGLAGVVVPGSEFEYWNGSDSQLAVMSEEEWRARKAKWEETGIFDSARPGGLRVQLFTEFETYSLLTMEGLAGAAAPSFEVQVDRFASELLLRGVREEGGIEAMMRHMFPALQLNVDVFGEEKVTAAAEAATERLKQDAWSVDVLRGWLAEGV